MKNQREFFFQVSEWIWQLVKTPPESCYHSGANQATDTYTFPNGEKNIRRLVRATIYARVYDLLESGVQ